MEEGRMLGTSTKLIDMYIQELFINKFCEVKDHFEYGENIKANEYLTDRILRRLGIEHRLLPGKNNRGMELKVKKGKYPTITLIEQII